MNKTTALKSIFMLIVVFLFTFSLSQNFITRKTQKPLPLVLSSPQPVVLGSKTFIKYPHDFTIVLVGDSMTERLGNADEVRRNLFNYYPDKTIEVLNYGYGATNILSLQERLEKETLHGRSFQPILDIDFDLIIIESFGNNPLSEYPLDEGLKIQDEALSRAVSTIKEQNPDAKIAFLATVAPSRKSYALNQVELGKEERERWAKERESYIQNHIKFAKENNIPLIDVFSKSKDFFGDGNLMYITKDDFIHPSPKGTILISKEIAEFIRSNNLIN